MSTLPYIGTIESINRKTSFYKLSENIILAERNECFKNQTDLIETFGPTWFFGLAQKNDSKIQIRNSDQFLTSFSNFGIIIPPFSLVHWRIPPGIVSWKGFFTQLNLFNFIKSQKSLNIHKPIVLKLKNSFPVNEYTFFNLIKNSQLHYEINHDILLCPIAKKAKQILDKNYEDNISIANLAKELNCHRSYLTRNFKLRYGVTPVEYRHMLRIYKSLELMNVKNHSVTYSAVESGFSNVSRFNHQFKNYHGIPASRFHFSKL